MEQLESSAGSSSNSMIILKGFERKDRREILKTANITSVEISADAMVAMKVDMGIPWEKLKTMARYQNKHAVLVQHACIYSNINFLEN